ncbi:hypothetical protein LINPERPRIM_LOCUS31493 [Linum perenne]
MGAGSSRVGHPQLRRLHPFRDWSSSSKRLDPESSGTLLGGFHFEPW